jgi:hypothetical protein
MPESAHSSLVTTNLHVPGYRQDSDPGAVGAGRYWVDSSGGTGAWILKVRNAADSGWEEVASGGGGAALTVQEIDGTPSDTAVTIIRVTNGKMTDNGAGDVTLDLSGGGGGGSLTIEEVDGTPSGVPTTLELPNGTLTDLGGGTFRHTPVQPLYLDQPPASAHAKDDEFDGSALDGKWTNPISSGTGLDLTLAVAKSWVIFEPTTSGTASTGKRIFGIRQVAPTGSFTISGKFSTDPLNDDARAGLWMAKSTGQVNFLGCGIGITVRAEGTNTYSESTDWGVYDGFQVIAAHAITEPYWLKMDWDTGTSTIRWWFSLNGVTWRLLTSRGSQVQPDRMGIGMWSHAGTITADHQMGCDWFRVTEP